MKFLKVVSLPFDPALSTQPTARLYQGERGKYYVEYSIDPQRFPLHIKGDDAIEAGSNVRATLYIMRAVLRSRLGLPPDFPPEYDSRLTTEMPAYIARLNSRAVASQN